MKRRLFGALALGLFLAAAPAQAYITSAILEYCADDELAFYLNGSVLKARTEFGPFDYDVLSTAGRQPLDHSRPFVLPPPLAQRPRRPAPAAR